MKWFNLLYHFMFITILLGIFAMIISAVMAGHVDVVIALIVLFALIATMH
jgi:hypothetical protein